MNSLKKTYVIDILADEAGEYFQCPSEEEMEYTDLFFSICRQFGIRYSNASLKEKCFVKEVTRVTWAHMHNEKTKPTFIA